MEHKSVGRMVAPDILKIAASLFVIIIHHKVRTDSHFIAMRNLLVLIVFLACVALGMYLFLRERRKNSAVSRRIFMLILPLVCLAALIIFRKFAVAIFLVVSGYLLCGSMDKCTLREWYTKHNIIPRILRFYLPFVFIFAVGLLYKIFILKYEYSILEVFARFLLGGFKPGSYYITILAELVIVFPIIYAVVKKFGFCGVAMCTIFTFVYDVCATYLGMSPVAYKFLIFRFTAHIAFGVYARTSEHKKLHILDLMVFFAGLLYAFLCMIFKTVDPKIFFQWQEASFPTAFLLYPVIVWFINSLKDLRYNDSLVSRKTLLFANATYHIFLVQLLYYTTFGFPFNEYVGNVAVTMPFNILVTVPAGIAYYKLVSPWENKVISKIKSKL